MCDESGFESLGRVWNHIASRAEPDNVFLRFEWFDAAWQWLKAEAQLHIFVARWGEQIAGIVPLVLYHTSHARCRQIQFLAVPDTQRCGIICESPDLHDVVGALATALRAMAGKWDVLTMAKMSQDAMVSGVLTERFGCHGLRPKMEKFGENPYIDIGGDWQSFYASRSRRLKKANNLAANRMAKAGKAHIDQLTPLCAKATQISEALATVIRISAQSWKQATGTSLDKPGPGAFIKRLTHHATRAGWLSLWLLRLDGTVIATEYQLAYEGRIYALRADFDKNLEKISPGAFLNRHMLERLFSTGLQRYMMGPGDNPYKRRWTDVAEPLVALRAYSPALRGKLWYLWLERLRPWIKRIVTHVAPMPKETADAE